MSSKFYEQLRLLGYSSYNDYLCDEHWTKFKIAYCSSTRPQTCMVCRSKLVQLHHVTYERLGNELLTDVVPLCDEHHEKVHAWLKSNCKPVQYTFLAVRHLREELAPKKVDKTPKPKPKNLGKKRKRGRTRKQIKAEARRMLGITKADGKVLEIECKQIFQQLRKLKICNAGLSDAGQLVIRLDVHELRRILREVLSTGI